MALTVRGWVVLTAALVTAAITARLGVWQLDRAAQKTALQTRLQARAQLPPLAVADLARDAPAVDAQLHRRVTLQGQWQARFTVYLDNRQMNARPGFYAVTPLLLDDGSAVLVQRGWLPRDPTDRTRIVAAALPQGPVQVVGRVAAAPSVLFEISGGKESGPIRQNLHLDDFSRETQLALRPLSVMQLDDAASPAADGLLRQWFEPAANVAKHHGYAVQWFVLSALSIGLYAWFQIIRPHLRTRRAS